MWRRRTGSTLIGSRYGKISSSRRYVCSDGTHVGRGGLHTDRNPAAAREYDDLHAPKYSRRPYNAMYLPSILSQSISPYPSPVFIITSPGHCIPTLLISPYSTYFPQRVLYRFDLNSLNATI